MDVRQRDPAATAPVRRLLVVNSGLLGARTFGTRLLPRIAQRSAGLRIEQILLTDALTLPERIVRRGVCQRLWTDRWPHFSNLDLARYRSEWHSGLLARKRLARIDIEAFDAVMFFRQPSAYASLSLIRRVPSIVDIDCTQECVRASMSGGLARATLAPGVRRDGQIFNAASLIVTSSQWAAGSVRTQYPGCRTPVEVLRPPVDLEPFEDAWIDARVARASAGERPVALFVGGDFRRKGGLALLQAWRDAGLADRARLSLATDWPLAAADLPSGVTVHRGVRAYSERWRELWREADLFVMPTRHEAFGLVFQEAAAAGLPRIGTRENAGPELIRDGADGLLVEPGDAQGLVHALRTLIDNAPLRASMGRCARASIAASASLEKFADTLEGLVNRAIELHADRVRAA
jgi:glycosyltransferase involved in cell wall biosynthesis